MRALHRPPRSAPAQPSARRTAPRRGARRGAAPRWGVIPARWRVRAPAGRAALGGTRHARTHARTHAPRCAALRCAGRARASVGSACGKPRLPSPETTSIYMRGGPTNGK
eukprot:scaffold115_cov304-Prasinococcus_capsulatus_cf.AAC.11